MRSSITRFEYKYTDYQKKEMNAVTSQLKENNEFCQTVQNNYEQAMEGYDGKYKFLESKVALIIKQQTQIIQMKEICDHLCQCLDLSVASNYGSPPLTGPVSVTSKQMTAEQTQSTLPPTQMPTLETERVMQKSRARTKRLTEIQHELEALDKTKRFGMLSPPSMTHRDSKPGSRENMINKHQPLLTSRGK